MRRDLLHLQISNLTVINTDIIFKRLALANLFSDDELNEDYIIPAAFDERVGPAVAKAVAEAARATGVARI